MSKVLVDRELLLQLFRCWDCGLEVDNELAQLRIAAAQPAETEGVELVPFWVLFDATTPEPLIKKHMPEGVLAFFDSEEDARRAKALHPGTDYKRAPYVRAAALSAVTTERDRLREDRDSQQRVCIAEMEKANQLRAEVEMLRALLGKSLPVVEAHAGASHMLDGFRPARNKWDDLVDGIRAAMAAKEA